MAKISRFNIVFLNKDEVSIKEYTCKRIPCTCTDVFRNFDCGHTPEQAKQYVINYYQMKAEYVESQTLESFLLDFGGLYP